MLFQCIFVLSSICLLKWAQIQSPISDLWFFLLLSLSFMLFHILNYYYEVKCMYYITCMYYEYLASTIFCSFDSFRFLCKFWFNKANASVIKVVSFKWAISFPLIPTRLIQFECKLYGNVRFGPVFSQSTCDFIQKHEFDQHQMNLTFKLKWMEKSQKEKKN